MIAFFHDYNNSSTCEKAVGVEVPQILNFLFVSRFEVTYGLLRLCKGTILDRYFHELLDKSYSGPFLPNHPHQIVSILFSFKE